MFNDPLVTGAASLYIRTGSESCNKFLGKFLDLRVRPFYLRIPGSGSPISSIHASRLRNLEMALSGADFHLKFEGFCVYGGIKFVNRHDPQKVMYGIAEVVEKVSKLCPQSKSLGIVAKVGDLKYSTHGIVMCDCDTTLPAEDQYIKIVQPKDNAVLMLQPGADRHASPDDEARECIEIADYLRQGNWQGMLLVYNGDDVVERELRQWAELGRNDTFWRVLIVNGSGRIADTYASDKKFLNEHPRVYVCDNNVEDIRYWLYTLAVLKRPPSNFNR